MRRLQPPPVFYQPNYGDGGECLEDIILNIANPMETEYTDIEETIRVCRILIVKYYISSHDTDTKCFFRII